MNHTRLKVILQQGVGSVNLHPFLLKLALIITTNRIENYDSRIYDS
jgi:hypothetical protein